MLALLYLAFNFSIIALTFAATSPHISVPVESRSIEEIYQAALLENGTLRVYWGGDIAASGQGIISAFQNRFPGIDLVLTVDLSKSLDSAIDIENEVTNGLEEPTDVAVLQTLHDFPRWNAQGRLMPYKVAQWNDIYPQFVDSNGAYTGCYIFTFGSTVYNKHSYPDLSLIPTTYPEFLEPRFNNNIALTYPNDDDAILYLFTLIINKYTWSFMNSLAAQNVTWVRGTATPSVLCVDTPAALSISFASSSAFASGVDSILSRDVYMAWPQTAAIFARTNVPEASKLFLSFLLDDEWQTTVSDGNFATRRSLDGLGVFKQANMDPLGYARFMQDREEVERWRLQFESILGPPQGPNPLDLTF